MAHIEHSIHIDRPIEEVFAYVTDANKLKDWNGDLVDSHGDPPALGSKQTQVRTILGRKVEATTEVTEWNPPNSMTVKSVGGGTVDVAGTISCQAMGGGTHVTLSFDLVPAGVLKIAEGVFAGQASKSMERDLNTLKQILES